MTFERRPTYDALARTVRGLGLRWFDGGRAWNLNLVLLRRLPGTLDVFDDLLVCAYRPSSSMPVVAAWPCTADPGKPSVERPRRRDGTAQLAPGQHRAAFALGLHRGQYRCLVATRALPVLRYRSASDFDADLGQPSTSSLIQVHRAGAVAPSEVGPWSEGCVVFPEASHLEELLGLCDAQIGAGLGDRFTLTVLPWAV